MSHGLWVMDYGLWVMGYRLRVTGYELWVTGLGLRLEAWVRDEGLGSNRWCGSK
jgi:hypothetical protein